jgi:hypothetical protein
MNRILKRPMFRMGGSSGTGITSGLDKPRQMYKEGEDVKPKIDTSRLMPTALPGFLTQFGLNLLSQPGGQNIFQTAATAAQEPFKTFQAAKLREKEIEDKFARDLALQLAKPQKQTLRQGVDRTTGKRGFFTTEEILNNPNIIPPDNRMAFTFDADSQTLSQVPVSERDKRLEDQRLAQQIVSSVNTVGRLKDDMIERVKNSPTGAVAGIYTALEGFSDQLAQASSALGFNENSLDFDINTSEKLDKYLEGKGITKGAANFGRLKGSVINLAYQLAKIKEPGNPKLSEGDIIRQLDRIRFGQSRETFIAGLNQIFDDEVIAARGQIEGYGLNPDDYFKTGTSKKKSTKGSQTDSTTVDDDPAGIRDYL